MIRTHFFKNAKFAVNTLLSKQLQASRSILYKSSLSKCDKDVEPKPDKNSGKEVFFPPIKMQRIKDRVALVTGGTDEIGLRCVKELLKCGAKGVMIADSNKNKGCKTVMELSKKYGAGRVAFIEVDPANYDMLKNAFTATANFYKSLDIVVNNVRFVEKKWEDQVDECIKGIVLSTQLSLEFMGKNNGGNGGTLVNVTSDCKENSESLPLFMAVEDFIISFDRCVASAHFDSSNVKVLTICKATFANVGCDLTTVLTRGTNGCVWMP